MDEIRQNRYHALQRNIERLTRRVNTLSARLDQLATWRLLGFFGGLVVTFFAFGTGNTIGLIVTALWLMSFAFLVAINRRVQAAQDRLSAIRRIKRDQIARMTLNWQHIPPNVADANPEHPYARDIDIVGEYSLHRLLDTSIARGGSQRLLDWLLAAGQPDRTTIQQRQALLQSVLPLKKFREGLRVESILANPRGGKWNGEKLLDWLENHAGTQTVSLGVVLLLAGLSVFNIVTFILNRLDLLPPVWIVTFPLFLLLSGVQWSRLGSLFNEASALQNALVRLRAVFRHLERYPYRPDSDLARLCQPFHAAESRPSGQLGQITVIVSAASLQRNPVLWFMINALMPWDVFFAYRLGRTRGNLAQSLPRWLDTWYDLEALNALAEFAYLNPTYTLPSFRDGDHLQATTLGHPLIPHAERIRNDFTLDGLGNVVIITGSNMSGKSSFLRTVGVNMTLAYAGSVVDADKLDLGLFRLFTCIRVTDSVVDGISYFYAEVRRLKALLNAARQPDDLPLFFLIDEIFRGTNNRERLIGSQSFIRAMVGGESLGLISTHDLELVKLADDIPQISNYHFREHVEDKRMVFDYILRPGPSPTTNALKIMEIEGLPVSQ